MTALRNLINQIANAMHMLSGVLLISMMLVTLIDVLTRTLYGLSDGAIALTFIGGVELIKYGLLFTILFTLPQSVGDSQVVVDLFTDRMSERAKIYLESFYLLGFALLGAGMTYRFYDAIESAILSGETTQDLMIPMPWVYRIVVFATAMLTLRCLLLIWELIRSHHRNQDTTTEAHATSLPHSNQQHKEVM
ncbi:TRAP transporter small permease [Stutzerimonas xanthomarina]|uniref:TRAP transporter small permease n=1 Tax=Stutzerimonas xanthomarina TaxID=271420 RepID=UPI003AA8DA55